MSMKKLIPINEFIIVSKDTKSVTQTGFVTEEEAKGEGVIVKCKVENTGDNDNKLMGKTIYVPQYALRNIEEDIYSCSYKSIVAYED